ncbi:MAG: creatininase family protein [Nitrosopumilaceae archaeon]
MTIIKDQFDPNLRKLVSRKKQAAIIPVGSIEQHGAHLPISTDSDIVSEVANRISKKGNFLLLPTLNYGVSFEHAPFFNLSLKGTTLQQVLSDLILSLGENGIKVVFVINGHHGNQKPLKNISQKIKKLSKGKIKVFVFSYWHFMKMEFDHAGFVETSLMQAISKNVKMENAKKGFTTEGLSLKEKSMASKKASKSFPSITKNGVWGDPRRANAKDGKKILSEVVYNLQKKCQTCLTGKSPKLHK